MTLLDVREKTGCFGTFRLANGSSFILETCEMAGAPSTRRAASRHGTNRTAELVEIAASKRLLYCKQDRNNGSRENTRDLVRAIVATKKFLQ